MLYLRWIVAACGIGLAATAGWAVPRNTASPKNDRHLEDSANIESILDETDALPPIVIPSKGRPAPLTAARLPRFTAEAMTQYRAKYPSLDSLKKAVAVRPERYLLIGAVLHGMKALQKHPYPMTDNLNTGGLAASPQLKAKIFKDQKVLAVAIHDLEEALIALEKAGQADLDPPPRWQANYHFVRARLMLRLVHLHEYSLMLGRVRRDSLPPLEKGQSGWRIIAVSSLQATDRQFKLLEVKGRAALKKLVQDHPKTPWAYLAKRDLETALGLDWIPIQ